MQTIVAYKAPAILPQMEVVVLPATKSPKDIKKNNKRLRVAAYCRVSTDDEEQLTSYEAQIEYYTNKIETNLNWVSAGIFADEGITGVCDKKREKFLEMIELCRAGKIDHILTKSVSRFSRNTADSIRYIRELKSLNVSVYFEKENIDTSDMTSEMMLNLYSIFAQAESESISNNVKLGKRFGYKNGRVAMQYGKLLGYRRGKDGRPEIEPEGAKTVIFIYTKFLEGNSLDKIKEMLEQGGYKTARGSDVWSKATIRGILVNEKYRGDVLMQKSYTVDLFSKQTKKNTGELPMYLAKNHHTPIIEPSVFDRVQVELAKRNNLKSTAASCINQKSKFSSKYALTGIVVCGDCGSKYRRTTWSRNGRKKVVWRCINRLDHGTRYCEKSPTIDEDKLNDAVLSVINGMLESKDKLTRLLKGSIAEILSAPDNHKQILKLQSQIAEKNAGIVEMVKAGVNQRDERAEIEKRCKAEHEEVKKLQEQLYAVMMQEQMENAQSGRLKEIYDRISQTEGKFDRYDDEITRLTVSCVKVLSEDKIEVTLFNTMTVQAAL